MKGLKTKNVLNVESRIFYACFHVKLSEYIENVSMTHYRPYQPLSRFQDDVPKRFQHYVGNDCQFAANFGRGIRIYICSTCKRVVQQESLVQNYPKNRSALAWKLL